MRGGGTLDASCFDALAAHPDTSTLVDLANASAPSWGLRRAPLPDGGVDDTSASTGLWGSVGGCRYSPELEGLQASGALALLLLALRLCEAALLSPRAGSRGGAAARLLASVPRLASEVGGWLRVLLLVTLGFALGMGVPEVEIRYAAMAYFIFRTYYSVFTVAPEIFMMKTACWMMGWACCTYIFIRGLIESEPAYTVF